MDAWTILSAVKLLIDVIDGGVGAAVKGILMSGVPYSGILDAGEAIYGIFGLDGSYKGNIKMTQDQYRPVSSLRISNMKSVEFSLTKYDFPKLANMEFAKMKKLNFPKFNR